MTHDCCLMCCQNTQPELLQKPPYENALSLTTDSYIYRRKTAQKVTGFFQNLPRFYKKTAIQGTNADQSSRPCLPLRPRADISAAFYRPDGSDRGGIPTSSASGVN